jgi:ADP-ribose pyrophosphatase
MDGPPRPVALPVPALRPWKRRSIEPVGSFRIFDVQRLELEDAQGTARGDAFVVTFPDWCNVVAVTPDDHVVFVWQYRFGTDALSLEIPGGVVDAGEAPTDAARRELKEETGYEADSIEPLVVVGANPAIQNNRCHTFIARNARRTGGTAFDAQEELETVLVPADDVAQLLDAGQVAHSLVHSALEVFLRRRRGG